MSAFAREDVNGCNNILSRYLQAVLERNCEINLTSVTSYEDARVLHLEDSLLALPEVMNALPGPLVDIGTGGGFPGVPIAVATGRDTLLVDAREKKIRAVISIVESLEITGVSGYSGRAEELALSRPGQFSVVTARALSSLPSLLELASPLLCVGGVLIAYKSRMALDDEDEFSHAQLLGKTLGMYLKSWRRATIGDGSIHREIVVFQKRSLPTVKLPRRSGMAQKKPY